MPRKIDDDEFEDFADRVEDVEKTIKALMEGKLDIAEVDKKEEDIKRKQRETEERKQKKKAREEQMRRAAERAAERKKWGFAGRWCPRCRKDEAQILEAVYGKDDTKWPQTPPDKCVTPECKELEVTLLSNEERRQQLQLKVDDMKKERLAKAMARDRWNRWKSTQQYNRIGASETDYVRWDKWMPSDDEEEELPPAPPPDTAEFKMMEQDIEQRAKDKEKRRKKGDEFKTKGNAALAEGKNMKAFKLYSEGLQEDKSSCGLLCNRALASLRLGGRQVTITKLGEDVEVDSLTQCVDDCTKVLDICEFLFENSGPGIRQARVKAHLRRAAAYHAQGEVAKAREEAELGLTSVEGLTREDKKEFEGLRDKYKADEEEEKRLQRLRAMAGVEGKEAAGGKEKGEKKEGEEEGVPQDEDPREDAERKEDVKVKEEDVEGKAEDVEGKEEEKKHAEREKEGKKEEEKAWKRVEILEDDDEEEGEVEEEKEEGSTLEAKVGSKLPDTEASAAPAAAKTEESAKKESAEKAKAEATKTTESAGKKEEQKVDTAERKEGGAAAAAAGSSKNAMPKTQMRKLLVEEDDDEDEEEEGGGGGGGGGAQKQPAAPTPAAGKKAAGAKGAGGGGGGSGPLGAGGVEAAEGMARLMMQPEVMAAMGDPEVQGALAELMAGGGALTDEELLAKHKDKPALAKLYGVISQTLAAETPRGEGGGAAKEEEGGARQGRQGRQDRPAGPFEAPAPSPAAQPGLEALGENPLAGADAATLQMLREDPALKAALQDPEVAVKLAAMVQDPGRLPELMADPRLAALDSRLQGLLGVPGAGAEGGGGRKGRSKEEGLRETVQVVGELKGALEKGEEGAAGVERLLGELGGLLRDSDARALCRDAGGVEVLCGAAGRGSEGARRGALGSLAVMAEEERGAAAVVAHGKGRTVARVVAWMHGLEGVGAGVRVAAVKVVEAALQHEEARRALLGKAWKWAAGEGEGERIGVVRSAGRALVREAEGGEAAAVAAVLGVLTNAVYEEKGKEQLLGVEEEGAGVLSAVLRQAQGGGRGVQGRALRLLVNASSAEAMRRRLLGVGAAEAAAAVVKEEVAKGVAGGWRKKAQEEVLEAALGLAMNMGLEEGGRAAMAGGGLVESLEAVLGGCKWEGCVTRAAAAAARVVQLRAAAEEAVGKGLLGQMGERVKAGEGGLGGVEAMDAAVRGVAVCLKAGGGAAVEALALDDGALLALVGVVGCGRAAAVGNAALALQLVGNDARWLEALGKAGAVSALLQVVHHQRGAPQRNAALALARVVKREESLAQLKALHGLEVLNAYLRM